MNIRIIAQTSSEYAISFAVSAKDGDRVRAVVDGLIASNPLLPLDDVMVVLNATLASRP